MLDSIENRMQLLNRLWVIDGATLKRCGWFPPFEEIRPWLVLPFTEGYWPNERNVDQFAEFVYRFVDWVELNDLGLNWIGFDMEPNFAFTKMIMQLLEQEDYLTAVLLMLNNYSPWEFERAVEKYNELVTWLHQRGFSAMAVTCRLDVPWQMRKASARLVSSLTSRKISSLAFLPRAALT